MLNTAFFFSLCCCKCEGLLAYSKRNSFDEAVVTGPMPLPQL